MKRLFGMGVGRIHASGELKTIIPALCGDLSTQPQFHLRVRVDLLYQDAGTPVSLVRAVEGVACPVLS